MRFTCSLVSAVFVAPLVLLGGCAVSGSPFAATSASAGAFLSGSVHGGQQPVGGALVSLMAPGTTGYGSAPTLIATTTTDAGGNFQLPSYTCPANAQLTYLYVTGGNAGSGLNGALAEAAVLGPCSSLSPQTFVVVSEVTTVVAAYVLSPFAAVTAGITGIGAPSTNLQGLANTFGPANNLVNFSNGAANSPNAFSGITLPQAELNTLANILASCVNSSGAGSTTCKALFAAATPPGSTTAPVDTFQAALNIALNPGSQVSTLYGLSSASAPFQPVLTSAPSDFTVAIAYTGAGIAAGGGTAGVAIDGSGNAFVANGTYQGGTPNPVHAIVEITPAGLMSSFGQNSGISGPDQMAFDTAGNLLLADSANNNVLKFSANGSLLGTFTAASFSNPNGLAIGMDGLTSWVSSFNAKPGTSAPGLTHIDSNGSQLAGSPVTAGYTGAGVAIDAAAIWVANANFVNSSGGSVTRVDVNTLAPVSVTFANDNASAMAIDRGGNAWTTLTHNVAKISDAVAVVGTYSTGSGIPQDIFFDGLNRAWVSNYTGSTTKPGSVIVYDDSGNLISPLAGYTGSGIIPGGQVPGGIAIDGSGNVWITGVALTSSGTFSQTGNAVAELIGAAAPVVTPLITANRNGTRATRP